MEGGKPKVAAAIEQYFKKFLRETLLKPFVIPSPSSMLYLLYFYFIRELQLNSFYDVPL
jgi:hypothetical protein